MKPVNPRNFNPSKPGTMDLVQLSDLPMDQWMGRAVLHPMCQHGSIPYWNAEDDPSWDPEDEPGPAYDVGMVIGYEPSEWRGDPEDPSTWEVWFLVSAGFTLHYGAYNLWTPRPAAAT